MYGYEVGRITAKCRRRAAAPRCLLAFYILHAVPLTLLCHLYNFPPHLRFSSSTQLSLLSLCLPFGTPRYLSAPSTPGASAYRSDAEVADTPFLLSVLATDFCARAIFSRQQIKQHRNSSGMSKGRVTMIAFRNFLLFFFFLRNSSIPKAQHCLFSFSSVTLVYR